MTGILSYTSLSKSRFKILFEEISPESMFLSKLATDAIPAIKIKTKDIMKIKAVIDPRKDAKKFLKKFINQLKFVLFMVINLCKD